MLHPSCGCWPQGCRTKGCVLHCLSELQGLSHGSESCSPLFSHPVACFNEKVHAINLCYDVIAAKCILSTRSFTSQIASKVDICFSFSLSCWSQAADLVSQEDNS